MKHRILIFTIGMCCLAAGCSKTVRSISQSGYEERYQHAGPNSRELDEFDVLGLDREKSVTEEDIQRAVSQTKPVKLAQGSTILLIQSGAVYPDGSMVSELSKHLNVVPFTGVAEEQQTAQKTTSAKQSVRNAVIITDPDKPATIVPLSMATYPTYRTETPKADRGAYSRQLRLAAAKAGASTIVCYWGILESGTEKFAQKTISWFPVASWAIPDERELMRIRLKLAVIDVASGSWSVVSIEPPADKTWSTRHNREMKDQTLVESLKQKAYEAGAKELIQRYATVVSR